MTTSLFSLMALVNPESTSARDVLPIEGLQAFPNLARDMLTLQSEMIASYSVKLLGSDGKLAYQILWRDGIALSIPMVKLSSGNYFLVVEDPVQLRMSTYKIVKH